jgi:hypothetical protein
MESNTLHRNALIKLADIINNENSELKIKNLEFNDIKENIGSLLIKPESPEHGEVRLNYFAYERELVILTKSEVGYKLGKKIKETIAYEIPPLNCSVYLRP